MTEKTITNKRCTCDDFCDDPCPLHGYGELDCDCGRRIRAPLRPKDLMVLKCPHCHRHWYGVEESMGPGFWVEGRPKKTEKTENTAECE